MSISFVRFTGSMCISDSRLGAAMVTTQVRTRKWATHRQVCEGDLRHLVESTAVERSAPSGAYLWVKAGCLQLQSEMDIRPMKLSPHHAEQEQRTFVPLIVGIGGTARAGSTTEMALRFAL